MRSNRGGYPAASWRRTGPRGGLGSSVDAGVGVGRPLAVLVVVLATLGILIGLLTPWHPLPGPVPGGAFHPDPALDFTRAQLARSASFHGTIRPWGLAGLAVSIVVPAVFGFTPLGAAVIDRLPGTDRPWLRVAVAAVLLEIVVTLVGLPIGARELAIERQYGLSTQSWATWTEDVGKAVVISAVALAVAMMLMTALARVSPRRWWLWGAGLAAALVLAVSFVYPITIAPLLTRTSSLPGGSLRTSLLALARADGQPLDDILVAHEGSRTTAENASVTGFGSSKRLILDDTLLHDDTPAEIRVITAHELGHAKTEDVLHGTIEAALAAAAALCLAGALLAGRGGGIARWVGANGPGDPRIVPLLLASFVVLSLVASPLVNVVSRRIEARADAHSLDLARDPQAYVAAQRSLAVSGITDLTPSPVLRILFFDHPPPADRLAMARNWAAQHDRPVPTTITGARAPRQP